MKELTREAREKIKAALEIRPVLEYLNYRLDTVQETPSIFRCFCPIHREGILRTLSIDKRMRRIRCSYAACPGRNGGDLADLVAMAQNVALDEALRDLARHFRIGLPLKDTLALAEEDAALEAAETTASIQPMEKAPPAHASEGSQPAEEVGFEGDLFDVTYEDLAQSLEKDPKNLEILAKVVTLCRQGNRPDLLYGALRQWADAAVGQGDYAQAADALGEYVAGRPGDIASRLLYVECLERMHRNEDAARELMEATLFLKAENRLQEALDLCPRMERLAPDSEAVFSRRVQLLLDLERYVEAVGLLTTRADALLAKGLPDAAIRCWRRILEIDPGDDPIRLRCIQAMLDGQPSAEDLQAVLNLIDGFAEKETAVQALNLVRDSSALFPDLAAILERAHALYRRLGYAAAANETALDIAEVHADAGQPALALERLAQVDGDSGDPVVLLSRKARILEKIGRKREAAQAVLRVIAFSEHAGDFEKAGALHGWAMRLDAENPEVCLAWFRHLANAGENDRMLSEAKAMLPAIEKNADRDGAEKVLTLLCECAPQEVCFLLAQADLLLRKGQAVRAHEQFLRGAEILVAHSKWDQAIQTLQRLLQADPQNLAATELLADCRARTGARPQALLAYQSLNSMYAQWGMPEKQLAILLKIAAISPSDVRALQQILELHEQLGNSAEALAARRQLAQLYFDRKAFPRTAEICEAILRQRRPDAFAFEMILLIHAAMRRLDHLRKDGLAFLEESQRAKDGDAVCRILGVLTDHFPEQEDIARLLAESLHHDLPPEGSPPLIQRVAQTRLSRHGLPAALEFFRECLSRGAAPDPLAPLWMEILNQADAVDNHQAQVGAFADFLLKQGWEVCASQVRNAMAPKKQAPALEAVVSKDSRELARPPRSGGSGGSGGFGESERSGDAEATDEGFQAIDILPIKPEYSFDNFIVGSNNNFAHATALAIARNPGDEFNPLFLYGDVGLGKTHLLHAIANHLAASQPSLRLLYTSSRDFTNGLIDAIQNNTIREFRAIHKSSDFLMIDDIQALSGQERAQEEFFQIFNALYQANRQIVLTSDRPPKEITHLEKRLRSRFGSGIIVDIQAPALETRIAILRSETQAMGMTVDDEILEAIALGIDSNIRELKAALKQIAARMRIAGEQPTQAMARQIAESMVDQSRGETAADSQS